MPIAASGRSRSLSPHVHSPHLSLPLVTTTSTSCHLESQVPRSIFKRDTRGPRRSHLPNGQCAGLRQRPRRARPKAHRSAQTHRVCWRSVSFPTQKLDSWDTSIIDQEGIRADPTKTSAVHEMQPPQNITELRRFMGMANQLGKFSPHLATLMQPLRELLSKKTTWMWAPTQEEAFASVKEELSNPTVLDLYDPQKEMKVSADASAYGLGAVLLQQTESEWKPIAYASWSMSEVEQRYAQIEKEALAITWACEKLNNWTWTYNL